MTNPTDAIDLVEAALQTIREIIVRLRHVRMKRTADKLQAALDDLNKRLGESK